MIPPTLSVSDINYKSKVSKFGKNKKYESTSVARKNVSVTIISSGFGDRIFFCSKERTAARRDTYSGRAGSGVTLKSKSPLPLKCPSVLFFPIALTRQHHPTKERVSNTIRWYILCPVRNISWIGKHFSSLIPMLDYKRQPFPKKST